MDPVTALTLLIGVLVIAAAIFLQKESAEKKTTKPTPIVREAEEEEEEVEVNDNDSDEPAPVPVKPTKKKKKTSTKKAKNKRNAAKKKKAAAKKAKEKKEAEAARKELLKQEAAAEAEAKKANKKGAARDNIAGTAKDGTSGMFGASYSIDQSDDEGWNVVQNVDTKSRSPRKTQEADGNSEASKSFSCTNLGKLIGKGGETIQRLSEDHDVKIDTPDRGTSSNLVTVRGSAEAVAGAMAAITELLGDEPERAAPKASATHTVNNIGKLIGKGGATIKGLSEDHRCRIDTPKGQKKQAGNVVKISGESQEDVDACVAAIKELLGDDDPTPQVFEKIKLNASQRPLIIGRGGATIRKLQEDSGANRINVDRQTGECKIMGSQAAVTKAAELIKAILKKDASMVTQTIKCDESRFGLVIGKGGSTIRKISEECGGVKIDTDKKLNLIKIRGNKNDVAKAVAQYAEILKERAPAGPFGALAEGAKFEIVAVADNLKGRVIGSGGATIKKLTAETGAKIDFARKGSDLGCRVSGTEEQIAAAVKAIEEIKAKAKEQEERAEASRAARPEDAEEETEAAPAADEVFVAIDEDAEVEGSGW